MSWDLGLTDAGDLSFSPSSDIHGISGISLLEQRMKIRLKVFRGSWVYDEDGSFGSQLHRLSGTSFQSAQTQAQSYVREALRDMPEIEVDSVDVAQNGTGVSLVINYHVVSPGFSFSEENEQQLEIVVASPSGGV